MEQRNSSVSGLEGVALPVLIVGRATATDWPVSMPCSLQAGQQRRIGLFRYQAMDGTPARGFRYQAMDGTPARGG